MHIDILLSKSRGNVCCGPMDCVCAIISANGVVNNLEMVCQRGNPCWVSNFHFSDYITSADTCMFSSSHGAFCTSSLCEGSRLHTFSYKVIFNGVVVSNALLQFEAQKG